jgi:nucleoside-diphosphate-sugar epimerase
MELRRLLRINPFAIGPKILISKKEVVMRLFITGASGFVGRHLVPTLLDNPSISLCLALRSGTTTFTADRISVFHSSGLSEETDWHEGLKACDVVIHAAARVHVMHELMQDPLCEYRKINVAGTLKLAKQAAEMGVKRFIFVSSIKVNGEETKKNQWYTSDDVVNPHDPYAVSKLEAERGLLELAQKTGMQVVIIRPPLVYGPGVKGNFLKMITWIKKGVPLPLGKINNKRSFVSVYNLVDLICLCVSHPRAANQVFLVSDGEDISTTTLLKKIVKATERNVWLIPVPVWALTTAAKIVGQAQAIQRLCGSLQLDISKTCHLLGWQPKQHIDEVLKETIDDASQ